MPLVRYLPEAIVDVEAIWRFVQAESGSVDIADKVVHSINEKCGFYAQHPLLGELRPELMAELRCFAVGSFVVFYLPADDGLNVLQVIHGAQDIPAHFRRK